ncbi:MAG: HEPN domain-containing protein [Candidatus Solibacter usitatus]|nr:HEPN domain-containing protein [Candidatus Solibacter usitatus]
MTERQVHLLRKARRKLAASKVLVAQGFAEDAVSCAYYAMFYLAEAFLEGEGLSFSSHAAVTGEFGRVFAKSGRVSVEFHRYLLEASEERLGGDYEDVYTLSLEQANKHVERAEMFLRLAEERLKAT